MKKLIILSIISMSMLSACNSSEKNDTKVSTVNDQIYACSMDPEIHGKKGEKCSKCGMELTEKVEMKSDSLK